MEVDEVTDGQGKAPLTPAERQRSYRKRVKRIDYQPHTSALEIIEGLRATERYKNEAVGVVIDALIRFADQCLKERKIFIR